jgi:HAD superfamily phosphatase (TIGR01668 family)
MAQWLNADFFRNLRYLTPHFITPDISVASINDVDWQSLRKKGIEGILFDADQTLVEYHGDSIHPSVAQTYEELRNMFEGKMAILSNYAGNKVDDRKENRRKILEANLGIPVIQSGEKKPNPRAYLEACRQLGVDPKRAAMVGDRLLTDIMGAKIAKMGVAIHVSPFTPEKDPWYTKVSREAEQSLFRLYHT